jgi:hypothetical protein
MEYSAGVVAYVTTVWSRENRRIGERYSIVSEVQSEVTVKMEVIKWRG